MSALLTAAAIASGIDRRVINIGTGIGTSINELVRMIEEVTGRQAQTIVNPSVSGGVSRLVADTSQAKQLLDFESKISLRDGLAMLIERDSQFAW